MQMTAPLYSIIFASIVLTLLLPSTLGLASNDFTCNKKVKVCYLDDSSIVMGDTIEFLTADGDIIATGTVTRMNGTKRTVDLNSINGDVQLLAKTYSNVEATTDAATPKQRKYTPRGKIVAGGHLGLTNLGRGDANGFEISGEGLKTNVLGNLDLQASASWYHVSGTANDIYNDANKGEFKANAFTLSAGPSFTFNERGPVMVRAELGLGFAYMSANINGSASNAKSEDWGYQINSGFGLHLRGLVALAMNFSGAQVEIGYEPAMLAGSASNTILAGVLVKVQ